MKGGEVEEKGGERKKMRLEIWRGEMKIRVFCKIVNSMKIGRAHV